jgi:pimeloyl-ACP methyl ester carboxylesterase
MPRSDQSSGEAIAGSAWHSVEVDGLRIAYQRVGEGPPLILLHGFFGDSRVWRRQLEDLSDDFDVVARDTRGCGRSSDPPDTYVLLAAYSHLADRLTLSQAARPEPRVSAPALRQAALGCLGRSQTNPDVGRGAIAVVMASEWVRDLARLEVDLEEAVSTAAEAAGKPRWR